MLWVVARGYQAHDFTEEMLEPMGSQSAPIVTPRCFHITEVNQSVMARFREGQLSLLNSHSNRRLRASVTARPETFAPSCPCLLAGSRPRKENEDDQQNSNSTRSSDPLTGGGICWPQRIIRHTRSCRHHNDRGRLRLERRRKMTKIRTALAAALVALLAASTGTGGLIVTPAHAGVQSVPWAW